MKNFFTISTLSLTALITAQYSLAKKFIYDDQTGLYSEIRDNQNYNNSGQYYSPPVYGQPQQQNGRYYYDTNRDQRIDTTMPRPSWDWKKGDKIPEPLRTDRFKVKSNDSPRIYNVGPSEQWYKINSDYVLVDHRYKILDIVR